MEMSRKALFVSLTAASKLGARAFIADAFAEWDQYRNFGKGQCFPDGWQCTGDQRVSLSLPDNCFITDE